MLNNSNLKLSEEQWARYRAWADPIAKAYWDEDISESLEFEISMTFSLFGRGVETRCGDHKLVLEEVEY